MRPGLPHRRPGRKGLGGRGNDPQQRRGRAAGDQEGGRAMKKARLATMWLDGCSGCHMSLLDIDEAIVARRPAGGHASTGRWSTPRNSRPTSTSPSSRAPSAARMTSRSCARCGGNARILVALGDCAVTGNVPAMRNPLPVKGILERVYVEGADVGKGIPTEGVPHLLKQSHAAARRGEGRPARAGLPAPGADDPVRRQGIAGGPRPRPEIQRPVRLRRPPMKTIVIDPVTRIEGHAKITIKLDDDDQVDRHPLPRHAGARLREVQPRDGRFTRCPRSPPASAASARSAICWPRPRPATPS